MSGVKLQQLDTVEDVAYCEQAGEPCQGIIYERTAEGAIGAAKDHTRQTGHKSSAYRATVRWYEPVSRRKATR